jgi:glutamate synthase (NADPH/NADH) large chain
MKSATILKSASCGVGFICNIKETRSHDIIRWGIEAVKNLTHRGAVGADGKTGDGAGVLFQLPKNFFLKEIQKSGLSISHIDNLAVGFFFLREGLEGEIEKTIKKFGLKVVAWRDVPTNDDALGQSALSAKPCIRQLLIDAAGIEKGKREFNLFLARRVIEKTLGSRVYVVSLSSKTIIYKGMLVATNLDRFYPDLLDSDLESAFCMFHQRFSTNTLPDWSLAQPFRTLGHNGEINTIHGNRNWMVSMEHEIRHQFSDPDSETITPLISFDESDSASLDRIVELLTLSGFPPEHAITMCVPPALECCDFTEEERGNIEAFFEYQSLLMKPWDGPAALVFTDGDTIGAHLDRNGLRPLRYLITEDGILLLGSEAGMVDLGKRPIMAKGRLGPGETLSVNTINGTVRFTQEILRELSSQKPYREWIDSNLMRLRMEPKQNSDSIPEITRKQIAFGYTSEEIQTSLREMARSGKEMTYSMGDDTALPPLSEKPQLLFRYFRQRFSQVTNPPIDHIREKLVMSLRMNLGHKMSFLTETPQHARRLSLDSPILLGDDMAAIEQQTVLKTDRIPITFPIDDGVAPLSNAVKTLQQRVISSVKSGGTLIILSDRDISGKMAAIPALLAVSACFRALRSEGISNKASLILETGEARDIHHMACLISYNASAVYPYLAFHTIKELCDRNVVTLPYEKAVMNYKKALENGLLKVIAKMGISTLNSYYGAELFDTVCLNRDFVEEYFRGTPVSIESDGLPEIEHSLLQRHAAAFATPEPSLDYGGNIR